MPEPAKRSKNGVFAVILSAVVVGMVGLAYAGEPAYRLFCKVTGYGGTTQIAEKPAADARTPAGMVTVQFDANVNNKLPWRFKPVRRKITVRLGEEALVFFEATNVSDKPLVGTATFNVAPFKAGAFFNKTECFCFTEQVLAPGETVSMAVSFFIDREMATDPSASDVKTVTLSYTFFEARDQSAADKIKQAEAPRPGTTGPDGRL